MADRSVAYTCKVNRKQRGVSLLVSLPRTAEDILQLFEQGQLTPAEAFSMFRQLDARPPGQFVPRRPSETRLRPPDDESDKQKRVAQVLEELDRLIGLDEIKTLVREVRAFVEIQQRRKAEMLVTEPVVLHMVFKGNPGTGKTTVARIFGRIFRELGVLPKGHLIEGERADLVGEYIGHTAQKSRELVKKALGGILFVDEAYSLARGGEKDFGKEAIDSLVKAMEDHKEELILILAGYRREMDYFLHCNPGLRSRFPIQIDFPDYSLGELQRIADLMVKQRQYRLSPEAKAKLENLLQAALDSEDPHFGNARLVRNIIERAIRKQAVRLVERKVITRTDLMLIRETDIEEVLSDW
jgi:stage V sporulation protein K